VARFEVGEQFLEFLQLRDRLPRLTSHESRREVLPYRGIVRIEPLGLAKLDYRRRYIPLIPVGDGQIVVRVGEIRLQRDGLLIFGDGVVVDAPTVSCGSDGRYERICLLSCRHLLPLRSTQPCDEQIANRPCKTHTSPRPPRQRLRTNPPRGEETPGSARKLTAGALVDRKRRFFTNNQSRTYRAVKDCSLLNTFPP
jgi:hypothetical protein